MLEGMLRGGSVGGGGRVGGGGGGGGGVRTEQLCPVCVRRDLLRD